MKNADVDSLKITKDGIYIKPPGSHGMFFVGDFIHTTQECRAFFFPNGGFNGEDGVAEVVDYASGKTGQHDFSKYLGHPAPLPPSETQGLNAIDIQSNVFGNLPPLPSDYVSRKVLEEELLEKLCDRNHEIVTLHGIGGMGKTYLALAVAHQIATEKERFDSIVWFSSRDLDLRTSGPRAVRPQVISIQDVFKRYGALFAVGTDAETFSLVLQGANNRSHSGTLFVFDNFETMEDITDLHRFLDQHTTYPNKVLLTTRERAFKADYPIEVQGMERSEAEKMVMLFANELNISPLLTPNVFDSMYEYTAGHPYVMKVIVGEIAKEGRFVPSARALSSRQDVANAVFERSFKKLSDDARTIFLCITNWKSLISELSLLVALGSKGIAVEKGIEECARLSLVYQEQATDGQTLYYSPELARAYGKKKLAGDPDKLVINEYLDILRRFGVTSDIDNRSSQKYLIGKFVSSCFEEAKFATIERIGELDTLLESLAELWTDAWLDLARFRRQMSLPPDKIDEALRRAVEENPDDVHAWLERADFAKVTGSEGTRISSLVSAVEADPSNVDLIKETAFQLAKYIKEQEIPPARRSVYLSSVRSHMQKIEATLDAVGLSRLAWLFLLDGDKTMGKNYALMGLRKDPDNNYCLKILENSDF